MKRIQRKEVVMLLLPSVVLLGVIFLLPFLQEKSKRTLTLVSTTVSQVAKSQRNDPDVEVNAHFNYSLSFVERHLRPIGSMTITNTYITDKTGGKHYMMTWTSNAQKSITPTAWSFEGATFPLWLRYFPKSAGKLTFHFTAIAHDGFKLPVSVVVRN